MSAEEDSRAREQRAIRRALLDPDDDREYFVYLTNRAAPLAGPGADLAEFSWGALADRFGMGYTNLWVLQRLAVYAASGWVELPRTASPDHSRTACGGPDTPHFVLLAMGDWPGAPDPWHLSRGTAHCTAEQARQAAADLAAGARRDGLGDVPPLLCALRLHDHAWH